MKRFVTRFGADGSSAAVIEYGLIMVLVGLACITAWMHVSASLKIPSASANTTVSVETTGSVRSHDCTVRSARGDCAVLRSAFMEQVALRRFGSEASRRLELGTALSRSCAAFPPRLSLSLQQGQ